MILMFLHSILQTRERERERKGRNSFINLEKFPNLNRVTLFLPKEPKQVPPKL